MEEALLEFLLERLKSLLILQESEIFSGLKDEILLLMIKLLDLKSHIQLFKSRLYEIGYFTEDHATSSKELKKSIQNWLSKLRETFYDADDCMDRFMFHMNSQDVLESELRMFNECLITEILDSKSLLDTSIASVLVERREIVSMKSSSHVDEGETSLAFFALKFTSLPFYLKSCLSYCCHQWGEDKEKLIRLLMAEGLVQEIPGERMEDTAEENINKLLELGMLQGPNSIVCTVPVPLHSFLAGDENLIILHIKSSDTSIPLNLRNIHISPIRSLFVSNFSTEIPCSLSYCLENSFYNFKLLRVLEISSINFKLRCLPEEMGNLIHLRYFGLQVCQYLNKLPDSLGSLRNLQSLVIYRCFYLKALPSGILNLVQLRHLELDTTPNLGGILRGIGRLKNLQTLTGLYAGGGIASELSNLTQLRKLGVVNFSEEHESELYASITNMTGLLSLSLAATNTSLLTLGIPSYHDLLPSLESFSPSPLLGKLELVGCLQEIPDWLSLMENLTELVLTNSCLSDSPTSVIGSLPKLKFLTLEDAYLERYIGREFCRSGEFPSLEVLTILSQSLIEWTELEEGALPSLKVLHFYFCLNLRTVPEGLQRITTLQKLEFFPSLHGDLARKLSPEGGKENYKIKHIPDVTNLND